MTCDTFRSMALSLPEAVESGHMGHPDFRVGGKIFATLAREDESLAMVKLAPDQQDALVQAMPEIFEPCAGMWGAGGATYVRLKKASKKCVREALVAGWCNTAPKRLVARSGLGSPANGE